MRWAIVLLVVGGCTFGASCLQAQVAQRASSGSDPADLLPDTRKSGPGTLPYGPGREAPTPERGQVESIRPAPASAGAPASGGAPVSGGAPASGGAPVRPDAPPSKLEQTYLEPQNPRSGPSGGPLLLDADALFVGPPLPPDFPGGSRTSERPESVSPSDFPNLPRPEWLDPEQIVALQASGLPVLLIDGRETVDYYAGHIPGAIHLPWRALTTRGCGLRCGTLDPDQGWVQQILRERGMVIPERGRIVVYGAAQDGWGEEGRAFWTLEYLGVHHVALLEGGFQRWKAEGRPVARLSTAGTRGAPFVIQPRDPLLVTRGELKVLMKRPDVLLLDVREADEFHGTRKLELGRSGHLPGAINLPWKQVFSQSGALKPEAELRALLTQLKVTPDHHIIVYCSGGVRSSMVYAVLRTLGYPRVTNYAGSLWDWNEDPLLPLEGGS